MHFSTLDAISAALSFYFSAEALQIVPCVIFYHY
jgi:hypothetical protein